ncbi:uncharacterized protein LOC144040486 [Vanacampus margaritifer]
MHLLRITLLLLLLLPLASSCSSQKPLADLKEDYRDILETDLNDAKERIATLQRNTSCTEDTQRVQTCTPTNTDFVGIIHNLTCHMWKIRLNHTEDLVTSVLDSIECTCSLKPSGEHKVRSKRRRTAMAENHKRKINRQTKKLCKVTAILSSMTRCYWMLNSLLENT